MTANADNTNKQSSLSTKVGVTISPTFLGYFLLIAFGVAVLAGLQYQYWHGEFGRHALAKLNDELANQQKINAAQQLSNDALRADVRDLKAGLGAIEEHARLDLGLIKSGETFVELSARPIISTRELAVGVDSGGTATEPVDGLLDVTGGNATTDVDSDTGEP